MRQRKITVERSRYKETVWMLIVPFLLSLSVFLILLGPHLKPSQAVPQDGMADPGEEAAGQDKTPPYILSFDSIEEYKKLIEADSLSDEDFQKLVHDGSYDMNGIVSKEIGKQDFRLPLPASRHASQGSRV